MGVDASIYAKNAKTRYYFDRLYNIKSHWNLELHNDTFFKLQDIYDRLRDYKNPSCYKQEVIELVEICKKAWLEGSEGDRYHSYWCDGILEFVNKYGDDTYFVVTDHDELWPNILDQYKEFKSE